ncbi:MAG: aspartate kinase [Oscillospiraceae bacterium]|nr:aspartate kinase [Oscillospiraceae bacterium]
MLIVQKFGGSSVANPERVRNVAGIISRAYQQGNDVVVVLSAQGDTTDDLIEKAKQINPKPSKREMDMLLACGEQESVALMAMCIEGMGLPVVSLTGWQVGVHTSSAYGLARIYSVDSTRIREELDRRRIVLVAGFQGINRYYDVTTLGRGGSDTTAVALAVALKADLCQIFTDVDGVYTADPRHVPDATKIEEITYDEMLELASLGAQVLHNRSVEMAKRYGVRMEVLSSFSGNPGTIVKEAVNTVEKTYVSGVAQDKSIARFAVVGLKDVPGIAYKLFSLLAKNKINVDIILQSIGRGSTKDISFTVSADNKELCKQVIEEAKRTNDLQYESLDISTDVAKVSIVGAGMVDNPGVAATMFEALFEAGINIHMISTSEIKVSVLINIEDSERAMRAVHAKFFQ